MIKNQNSKHYDLEDRTLMFAKQVRQLIKQFPKTFIYNEDGKQLVRSSGSIGANYREANEALSKKDFLMRIKIARKEAKESIYWLQLFDSNEVMLMEERNYLLQEATELMMILSSIMRKSK